ncbi:hypothetical protein [Amycolatopsis sp. NPDC051128]|uniref:hypothetical protein n=1 Tax=Amycolatopsis sp. NPDC051128 TaxID=3155412 RepID=UPI0034247864
MNRERRLAGRDGYSRVLGFDILGLPPGARWLDLCCGSGRALLRAASWLDEDGVFVANFDAASLRLPDGAPAARRVLPALREAGFAYDSRARRVRRTGRFTGALPFRYLGADDRAGPNYTGQPAVHSYYESAL